MKNKEPNRRLKAFFKSIKGKSVKNQQEFAEHIGVTPQTISDIFNERSHIGTKVMDGLASEYPELNQRWLVFGDGEMIGPKEGHVLGFGHNLRVFYTQRGMNQEKFGQWLSERTPYNIDQQKVSAAVQSSEAHHGSDLYKAIELALEDDELADIVDKNTLKGGTGTRYESLDSDVLSNLNPRKMSPWYNHDVSIGDVILCDQIQLDAYTTEERKITELTVLDLSDKAVKTSIGWLDKRWGVSILEKIAKAPKEARAIAKIKTHPGQGGLEGRR